MGSRKARVLNYAPGPCITRMKDQILDSMPQVPLKISMENVSWIPVKESIRVLLKILDQDEYTNGAHVDYYDC
jgi:sepiapterin reductase